MAKIQPFNKPTKFIHYLEPGAVYLPYRLLSDDLKCVVDVILVDNVKGDVSNGIAILRAAQRVMQQCVASNRGGSSTGFSRFSTIAIFAKCMLSHLFL